MTGLNATGYHTLIQFGERFITMPQGPFESRLDGLSEHDNETQLLSKQKTFVIQVTACVIAGASLVAAMVTCYWFSNMKKVFRHR